MKSKAKLIIEDGTITKVMVGNFTFEVENQTEINMLVEEVKVDHYELQRLVQLKFDEEKRKNDAMLSDIYDVFTKHQAWPVAMA